MEWLENIEFRRDGDLTAAVMPDGTVRTDIRFVQLFPLRNPDEFISVIDAGSDGGKDEELGVIRTLEVFSRDQRQLVKAAINKSFFLPEIQGIRKVVTAGGIDEWSVSTDRGDKTLVICDRKQSIHVCDDGMMLITDMDKCRYRITRPEQLDAVSKQLLEKVMP